MRASLLTALFLFAIPIGCVAAPLPSEQPAKASRLKLSAGTGQVHQEMESFDDTTDGRFREIEGAKDVDQMRIGARWGAYSSDSSLFGFTRGDAETRDIFLFIEGTPWTPNGWVQVPVRTGLSLTTIDVKAHDGSEDKLHFEGVPGLRLEADPQLTLAYGTNSILAFYAGAALTYAPSQWRRDGQFLTSSDLGSWLGGWGFSIGSRLFVSHMFFELSYVERTYTDGQDLVNAFSGVILSVGITW